MFFNSSKFMAPLFLVLATLATHTSFASSNACAGKTFYFTLNNINSDGTSIAIGAAAAHNGTVSIYNGSSGESTTGFNLAGKQTVMYQFTADGNADLEISIGNGYVQGSFTDILGCIATSSNNNASDVNIAHIGSLGSEVTLEWNLKSTN